MSCTRKVADLALFLTQSLAAVVRVERKSGEVRVQALPPEHRDVDGDGENWQR